MIQKREKISTQKLEEIMTQEREATGSLKKDLEICQL